MPEEMVPFRLCFAPMPQLRLEGGMFAQTKVPGRGRPPRTRPSGFFDEAKRGRGGNRDPGVWSRFRRRWESGLRGIDSARWDLQTGEVSAPEDANSSGYGPLKLGPSWMSIQRDRQQRNFLHLYMKSTIVNTSCRRTQPGPQSCQNGHTLTGEQQKPAG